MCIPTLHLSRFITARTKPHLRTKRSSEDAFPQYYTPQRLLITIKCTRIQRIALKKNVLHCTVICMATSIIAFICHLQLQRHIYIEWFAASIDKSCLHSSCMVKCSKMLTFHQLEINCIASYPLNLITIPSSYNFDNSLPQ